MGFIRWLKRYDVDTERELDADAGLLPIEIEHRQSQFVALFFLVVGVVFLGTPVTIFIISRQLTRGDQLTLALPGILGVWITLRALRNLRRARRILVGEDEVQARERWLFGRFSWSEPLQGYEGLALVKTFISQSRLHQRDVQVDSWAVDLQHADPDKRVRLVLLQDEERARERWQELAARLGLRTIDRT